MRNSSLFSITILVSALIGAFLFVGACTTSKKVAGGQGLTEKSCITMNIDQATNKTLKGRAYELISLKLQNNCLTAVVDYSGGCSNPEISVNLLEIDRAAYPKQALIDIVIQGEDACRELVSDSIAINISYLEAMARDGGIKLRFAGQEKEFFYALPLK